jgi:very-short-patch-repair endonuclease
MAGKGSIERARRLRGDATEAEKMLWAIVRNRQLGGCKFRRQVPIGRYVADFACVERKVVVELDGRQHNDRADYDRERTDELTARGWLVLRFSNGELMDSPEGVELAIRSALEGALGTPLP